MSTQSIILAGWLAGWQAGRQAGRISPAFLGYTKEYRHTLDTVTA